MQNQSSFQARAMALDAALAAQSPEWLIAKNLRCFDLHLKVFGEPTFPANIAALLGFRELLTKLPSSKFEVSVKVQTGELQPHRFHLLCDPAGPHMLARILAFFEGFCAGVDPAPVHRFFEDMDWDPIRHLVCGIDLQEDSAMSRVKLWIFADDEPGNPRNPVQRALSVAGDNPILETLRLHTYTLLGYDLRFDGSSALRLYPDILNSELAHEEVRSRLETRLPAKALEAMEEVWWTHVQITSRNAETMLQFHLSDPDAFLSRWITDPAAARIHEVYRHAPLIDVVVSMSAAELESGEVRNFALYYLLADTPPL